MNNYDVTNRKLHLSRTYSTVGKRAKGEENAIVETTALTGLVLFQSSNQECFYFLHEDRAIPPLSLSLSLYLYVSFSLAFFLGPFIFIPIFLSLSVSFPSFFSIFTKNDKSYVFYISLCLSLFFFCLLCIHFNDLLIKSCDRYFEGCIRFYFIFIFHFTFPLIVFIKSVKYIK